MDFYEVVQSAGSCRDYRTDPVPDEILGRVFDAARYAPSGGNRQPVRLVVVRDPEAKRRLKDLYLARWNAYVEGITRGEVRLNVLPRLLQTADRFANRFHEVPVLVMVCAKLGDVHPTDHQLGRLSVVGGASIYPAVQNLLLACRAEGLGACLTTLLCFDEPKVKELLGLPEELSTAATVTIGYPSKPVPKKVTRRPASEFVFAERFGRPFSEATSA